MDKAGWTITSGYMWILVSASAGFLGASPEGVAAITRTWISGVDTAERGP